MNRLPCIIAGLALIALAGGMAGVARAQTLPTISIQDASVTEQNGGAGIINFNVFLSKRSTRTISVQVQTSDQTAVSRGSGQTPFDYIESGLQAMSFAPGDSVKQFAVTFEGDAMDEDNETFRVFLTNPTNATIGDGEAIGTIIDDDAPPTLRIANASAAEGNGRITFPVTLSNPSGRTITVAYATETGGTPAASIAANCGGGTDVPTTTGTLSIPSGQTAATIDVPVCDDAVFEQNEAFRVRLSSAVNASLGTSLATGTILNDDDPTVSIASQVLAEGNPPLTSPILSTDAQNLSSPIERTFTISLSGPTTRTVTLTLETRDGTANGGSVCRQFRTGPNGTLLTTLPAILKDYLSLPSQQLTIPAGRTSTTIVVSTCRDFRTEENESFQIVLTAATNAVIGSSATCTLNNDD